MSATSRRTLKLFALTVALAAGVSTKSMAQNGPLASNSSTRDLFSKIEASKAEEAKPENMVNVNKPGMKGNDVHLKGVFNFHPSQGKDILADTSGIEAVEDSLGMKIKHLTEMVMPDGSKAMFAEFEDSVDSLYNDQGVFGGVQKTSLKAIFTNRPDDTNRILDINKLSLAEKTITSPGEMPLKISYANNNRYDHEIKRDQMNEGLGHANIIDVYNYFSERTMTFNQFANAQYGDNPNQIRGQHEQTKELESGQHTNPSFDLQNRDSKNFVKYQYTGGF